MCDIWMDVDAALAEVPVNLLPLISDSDFKTRQTSVAYNASGMDLVWNFVTPGGAYTQTAVTPTTGGDYDWAHQGDGMYSIEIPASGGASINNDTEGFGWFSGIATGILPWRGPVIGFRAAGLNDLLIENAFSTTRGLAGTALPNAAAEAAGGLFTRGTGAGQINQAANGQIDANVVGIEGSDPTNQIRDAVVDDATRIDASALNTLSGHDPGETIMGATDLGTGSGLTSLASASALSTLDGKVDTVDGNVDSILADTNELQGDWANGGRLDLILDARASQSSVDDLPTNAELATALAGADDAVLAAVATVDSVVDAIKLTTDKLDDTLEDQGGGTYGFTEEALQEAPAGGGGSGPTAEEIADAVWEEAIADHSGTSGSTAEALNAAGAAGDPWVTSLPGSYSGSQAGRILADILVDTGTTLQGELDGIQADTEDIQSKIGTPAVSVAADIADVEGKVDDLESRLTSGRAAALDNLDATISSRLASSGYTAPLDAAGTRTALGLASANLDTQLGDLPTNSELATALGTADDAVLAQVALVKAKTDLIPASPAATSDIPSASTVASAVLTAAQSAPIDANVKEVNDVAIEGAGVLGDEWRPA